MFLVLLTEKWANGTHTLRHLCKSVFSTGTTHFWTKHEEIPVPTYISITGIVISDAGPAGPYQFNAVTTPGCENNAAMAPISVTDPKSFFYSDTDPKTNIFT
jgi:hypothetical protein